MSGHGGGTSSGWAICPAPRSDARARLFCLPSAGGGAAQYRLWPQYLPHDIELLAMQLPGRETRLREPLMRWLPDVVGAIGQAIIPYLDRPFAIFGHSMGALLAFEATRWLRREGVALPMHLFVSGRRAPQLDEPGHALHTLDDATFTRELVDRYNGIPRVILEDDELLQIFLPTLRADLQVVETYEYAEEEPLPCPITAFAGLADSQVRRDDLEAWRAQTQLALSIRQFPGDHFYLQHECVALIAEIVDTLGQSPLQSLSSRR